MPRRSQESAWSRRGLWAPSQPFCLNPPAVPRGRWQAWVSAFHWSDSWTSKGKGWQKRPFFLAQDTGWLGVGVWTLQPEGRVGNSYLSGSLQTLLKDHPLAHFPSYRLGSSGTSETQERSGMELAALIAGPGLVPHLTQLGLHTQLPCFCFLSPSV